MHFNLFSVIAASAISASVALPVSASGQPRASRLAQGYTPQYLQKSANFYAALDHKAHDGH